MLFRACAGVCGGQFGDTTFTPRLAAVMLAIWPCTSSWNGSVLTRYRLNI